MSQQLPIVPSPRLAISTATAGQTEFTIPWPFQYAADIAVHRAANADAPQPGPLLVLGQDYVITGENEPGGGTLLLLVECEVGEVITRYGDAVLERVSAITRGGKYSSRATDDDLDRQLLISQELKRDIDRAIKVRLGGTAGEVLPGTPGRLAIWGPDGGLIEGLPAGLLEGVAWKTAFAPAGGLVATDVQKAIEELDAEKQSADADLAAIAALSTSAFGRDLLTMGTAEATRNRLRDFKTVASMLASPLTYSAGVNQVAAGDRVTAQGFRYEVAATDATDHHIETAGGVKLYVLPDGSGINVHACGAKGDYISSTDTGTDDTDAIATAIRAALTTARRVYIPDGEYLVTDTLNVLNTGGGGTAVGGLCIQGENGNTTRIWFRNATPLKELFYFDTDVNYVRLERFEIFDVTPGTSRGVYFIDNRPGGISGPAWKHFIFDVRITRFAEGARFDGGATLGEDAHQSEVMVLHSKFRNCHKSLIYNNSQAVNHQLIGLDIENDAAGDASEKWPMIVMERGSAINHIGGSVIGHGPYLTFKYSEAAGFANTSQFVSRGCRVEKRGSYDVPIIDHDPASTITISNALRVVVEDMPVVYGGGSGTPVFARLGGRVRMQLKNIHGNIPATVDAYMTANLSSNAEYGSVDMVDCKALTYKRVSDVAAYGSAGVASSNYLAIPARHSIRTEGVQGSTVDSYYTLQNTETTIYAGGYQIATPKSLVWAPASNTGFGSGSNPATSQIRLPLRARPFKFRLLRDDWNAGSAFVLALYAVVGGTDYKVAEITPTPDVGGHFEANIQTASGLTYFVRDDVNWDGKMKITKTGTINGYVGLIMIDYM